MVQTVNRQSKAQRAAKPAPDILRVEYINSLRAFIVWMDNGQTYLLHAADLPEADPSPIERVALARSRRYFAVTQASGNTFDVPWDLVLHHCEPSYPYFKGRQAREAEGSRAARIGSRVRSLREQRGLSVAELARRAGLLRPNLSRLESGKHAPTLDTLERVAAAMGATVADVVAD